MTYEQIIQQLRVFTINHQMIQQFGYGYIDDIETPEPNLTGSSTSALYPYMFVNPSQHAIANGEMQYNFNIVFMDLSIDGNITDGEWYDWNLKAQSDCTQYAIDLITWLKRHETIYFDAVSTVTPFKERFNDAVAGVTLQLSITQPIELDHCNAPF